MVGKQTMQPQVTYLICAAPRTGSWLLADALHSTGLAGNPQEYFWRNDEPTWAERWNVDLNDYAAYLEAAFRYGTTPNGVWGSKLMWGYIDDLIRNLRCLPGCEALPVPNLFAHVFANLRYVWLRRGDTVRQAVSHWRAIQTDVWAQSIDETPQFTREPEFKFESIDYLVRENEAHNAAWKQFFVDAGVAPFEVVYEEFVLHYRQTTRAVLDYLGIAVPADLVIAPPRSRQQADALSDAWVAQYRTMAQQRSTQ